MSSLEREKADKAREHAIMAYRTMRKKQINVNKKLPEEVIYCSPLRVLGID